MKQLLWFGALFFSFYIFAQNTPQKNFYSKDTLLIIPQKETKYFYNSYILFIPKDTPTNKKIYLLVEPNNTGFTTDSLFIHTQHAIDLASKNSIGNNIATMLKIPILVPIFPRPASQPLIYTHALDNDVMITEDHVLKRPDLQLIEMIEDAKTELIKHNILTEDKVLMNGFSASATFVNRFAFLHPKKIKAIATGGLNGVLMLPLKKYKKQLLNYPLGINNIEGFISKEFDSEAYKAIPQFIYMGANDENDAVDYDDAYSHEERNIIYKTIGKKMQPDRWQNCQKKYNEYGINAQFKTYQSIGHWTTGEINYEIITFFFKIINSK